MQPSQKLCPYSKNVQKQYDSRNVCNSSDVDLQFSRFNYCPIVSLEKSIVTEVLAVTQPRASGMSTP